MPGGPSAKVKNAIREYAAEHHHRKIRKKNVKNILGLEKSPSGQFFNPDENAISAAQDVPSPT